MARKLGLIVAAFGALAGCTTLTTTSASVTFLHSPLEGNSPADQSGIIYGAELTYEVDRGQSRIGGCGLLGRHTKERPRVSDATALHFNSVIGSLCHMSDIGHDVDAQTKEERPLRRYEDEPSADEPARQSN